MLHVFPLGDDFVCLDTDTDVVRIANATGVGIWQMQVDGVDREQMLNELTKAHPDVPTAQIESDLDLTLENISAGGETVVPEPQYVPDTSYVPNKPLNTVAVAHYQFLQWRVDVQSERQDVLDVLDGFFPRAADPSTQEHTDDQHIVLSLYEHLDGAAIVHDGCSLDIGLTASDTAIKCMREINGLMCRAEPYALIIHASAVAMNENAVLFPGVGGSGKTTLSVYLTARGGKFLNDDTVPLRLSDGLLQPVPMVASIKEGSWDVLQSSFESISGKPVFGSEIRRFKYVYLGDDQIQENPIACRHIVLPTYSADTDEASLTPVDKKSVFEYLVQGGCIIDRPIQKSAISVLSDWVNGCDCYRLEYSELDDAYELLAGMD